MVFTSDLKKWYMSGANTGFSRSERARVGGGAIRAAWLMLSREAEGCGRDLCIFALDSVTMLSPGCKRMETKSHGKSVAGVTKSGLRLPLPLHGLRLSNNPHSLLYIPCVTPRVSLNLDLGFLICTMRIISTDSALACSQVQKPRPPKLNRK